MHTIRNCVYLKYRSSSHPEIARGFDIMIVADDTDPRGGVSMTDYLNRIRARNDQKHPLKRLIVCCDGSWQSSNHGLHTTPSNIAKLSRSLAKYETRPDNSVVHQVVFYDAGVGTSSDTVEGLTATIAKKVAGAFGSGLDENVCEAYNFLVNNYNNGDEIYLFGFSRGAYTARALAGLVCSVGLCTNDMMDEFWAMYAAYKKKKADQPIEMTEWGCYGRNRFIQGCIRNIKIKVVGVFDTVGALGWPVNTTVDVQGSNDASYGFHNTKLHPQIEYAFHALAIDEHRASFGPTLWSLSKNQPTLIQRSDSSQDVAPSTTKLIQCWFPGVHINIGGGSESTLKERGDLESMANITFAWMVDRVREYTDLKFDDMALHEVARKYAETVIRLSDGAGDTKAEDKNSAGYGGWGMARHIDSFNGMMKLAGSVVRKPGQYITSEETHEYIHPVVAYARDRDLQQAHNKTVLGYNPKALEGFERVKNPPKPANSNETPKGIYWRKVIKQEDAEGGIWKTITSYWRGKPHPVPDGEDPVVLLPEFVIPQESAKFKSLERWLASVDLSPYVEVAETRNRTKEFLAKLDRGD